MIVRETICLIYFRVSKRILFLNLLLFLFVWSLLYLTNKPVLHIYYVHCKSQRAIMYPDQLKNTNIDYSQKLGFDQFLLFLFVIMTAVANQYIISHHLWYLSYNRLSAQKSQTALFITGKTYSPHLNFKKGFVLDDLWSRFATRSRKTSTFLRKIYEFHKTVILHDLKTLRLSPWLFVI
jgi:hypothetical protein